MAEEVDATTRQQVLDLIVEKGPVTASAIAKVLGLTTAAVRRHITLLLESKEIAEHEPGAPSKRGRGRPARHYVATERAHIHLADGYSDLASKALGYLGQVGGEEAVESFAAARSMAATSDARSFGAPETTCVSVSLRSAIDSGWDVEGREETMRDRTASFTPRTDTM